MCHWLQDGNYSDALSSPRGRLVYCLFFWVKRDRRSSRCSANRTSLGASHLLLERKFRLASSLFFLTPCPENRNSPPKLRIWSGMCITIMWMYGVTFALLCPSKVVRLKNFSIQSTVPSFTSFSTA